VGVSTAASAKPSLDSLNRQMRGEFDDDDDKVPF